MREAYLDDMLTKLPPSERERLYSDGWKGVDRLLRDIDRDDFRDVSVYERRKKAAQDFVRYHYPEGLETLNLIFENGKNRKESIWQMTQKRGASQKRSSRQSTGGT